MWVVPVIDTFASVFLERVVFGGEQRGGGLGYRILNLEVVGCRSTEIPVLEIEDFKPMVIIMPLHRASSMHCVHDTGILEAEMQLMR